MTARPDSTSPPAVDRYPVVVVEDEDSTRTLIARALRARGYRVLACSNVDEALGVLADLPEALIVTDRALPGRSGFDLLDVLRRDQRDVEAVLVTARADVDGLLRSVDLGIFRCVLKPFVLEDLCSAVAGAAMRLTLRLEIRSQRLALEERNRELEAALAKMAALQRQRTLEERLTSIGRLAAGVAHEINTPLSAVLANLATIQEDLQALARERSEALTEIVDAVTDARAGAERVRVIVRDLRTLSRSDEAATGPVDLRRVVEASLNMAWNEIRHRARLIKEYAPVPPVEGNDARVGQVVLNLLLNAAQAIPDGDATHHEVRVKTSVDDRGRVLLEVSDSGVGMDEETLAHIFDPFFTTKPVGLGTGLGLSICHGIVTQMGGEIGVSSVVGRGSVFRVALPASEARPTKVEAASRATGPRAKVLAVDDDALVLTSLRRALGRHHDLVTVGSGREALGRLAAEAFDVVLCDLMMPEMSGMDLFRAIAERFPDVAQRVVFITGGTFTSRAAEFLESVDNLRIEKPFDVRQLAALISRLASPPSPPSSRAPNDRTSGA